MFDVAQADRRSFASAGGARRTRLGRRNFLALGTLGVGSAGLTLTDLLRAEARAGARSPHKAVIHIYLGGGPPHQDMWDIKTDAPVEIRGEFRPIATRVPGLHIGEVFPRIAGLMDKCAIIRSVVGSVGQHDPYQCTTGWPGHRLPGAAVADSGRPCLGSMVARLRGPVDPSVPPYVLLPGPNQGGFGPADGRRNAYKAGFLGHAYDPFDPGGPVRRDLMLNPVLRGQLPDRRRLLSSFDTFRRDVETTGKLEALDAAALRAFEMLTSSKVIEALDLAREPARVRQRYGPNQLQPHYGEQTWTVNESFLAARRLVEAGVRCVTLCWIGWDSHQNNFRMVRGFGAELDRAFSALMEDLDARGMLEDVTVLAWGEFGRTPRINKDAGRDHWPQVSCALLAGGGMRVGQVIGATNRLGEHAAQRPVHFQEIHATLYHNLGIDPRTTTVVDPTGRPQYLVESPVIHELL